MAGLKFCWCVHRPKHHKRSGRCRGDCGCQAGRFKGDRKRRQRTDATVAGMVRAAKERLN